MSDVSRRKIRKYLFRLYGNLISFDDPIFDSKKKLWIVNLKVDYPRIIRDDRTNEVFLRFLSMEKIGEMYFNEKFELKKATSREECIRKIGELLEIWKKRAERIITYASSDRLAKLDAARYEFNPIMRIVSNFIQREIITNEEIERCPRNWRLKQYLKLLEGLNLVKKVEEGYTYGNLFAELLRESKGDIEKFRTSVLSLVIRERYSILRDVLGAHQFEPYIHVTSCYYRPALEAERLLYQKPETVIASYLTVYGPISVLNLRHIIQLLIEVEAFHKKGKFLYGDEELFSRMLNTKYRLPSLVPRVV